MTKTPPTESGAAAAAGAPRRRLHILVADDNRDTVLSLMMLLREEGHEVQGVYDGGAALRAARRMAFDAMIIDIEMPELDGYALARELRARHSPTPPLLIAISGKWTRPSEKLLALSVGFQHYLPKPCDPNALLELLKPLALPRE